MIVFPFSIDTIRMYRPSRTIHLFIVEPSRRLTFSLQDDLALLPRCHGHRLLPIPKNHPRKSVHFYEEPIRLYYRMRQRLRSSTCSSTSFARGQCLRWLLHRDSKFFYEHPSKLVVPHISFPSTSTTLERNSQQSDCFQGYLCVQIATITKMALLMTNIGFNKV